MRDPVGINSRTETAIEQVVEFLGLPARLGALDGRSPWAWGNLTPEQEKDLTAEQKAKIAEFKAELAEQNSVPRDPLDFEAYITVALDNRMPEDVRAHICRVLSEKEKSSKRPRFSKADRNAWIAAAVETVHERGGFKCTRSHDIVKSDSACSIVTAALERLDVHIPERTVEDIWGSRDTGKVAEIRQSTIIFGSWFCPEKLD